MEKGFSIVGRKTKYNEAVENEKFDRTKIIQDKLNKEDIGTKELAVVTGMEERSVRNILNKLCENHPQLKLENFKDGKAYKFKANWNGLLTTLCEVASLPQYDGRKEQHSLEGYLDHIDVLMQGIDTYLTSLDQAFIKSHGSYQQAILEKKLYESLLYRIGSIVNQVGMMPATLRFQTLAGLNKKLEPVTTHLAQRHSKCLIDKHLYKKAALNENPNAINDTSFQEDLEEYLVSLLHLRMQGKDGIDETYNMEVVGATLLEQLVLGNLTDGNIDGVEELITSTKQDLLQSSLIKPTFEKVKGVLDEKNPVEQMVLNWIEQTLLLVALGNSNEEKNRALGKELLRQMVTEEVYRNLQEFNR